MLAPLETLWPILRCPVCQAPLAPAATGARCAGRGDAPGRHDFAAVGAQPLLVDFASSVLDADAVRASGAASPVPRSRSARPVLGAIVHRLRNPLPGDDVSARTLARLRAQTPRPRILVVGGGTASPGLRELYEGPGVETIGFDVYASPLTQFVADAHAIPLADGSCDGVWIQAVLEHVVDPWRVVAEIHRVLRPRGVVYSEFPFIQQVHEGTYDFVRLTERGQRWLFRHFEEVESGVLAGPGVALSWSIDHFVRSLTRSRVLGRVAGLGFAWLGWLDGLLGAREARDAASAYYFVGARSDTALGVKDLVAGYRGAQRRAAAAPGAAPRDATR
jgi:SAM-dependent methyltransferase